MPTEPRAPETVDESLTTETEGSAEIGPESGTEGSLAGDLQQAVNGAGEVSTVDPDDEEKKRIALLRAGYRVPSHGNGILAPPGFPPGMVRVGAPPSPTARLRDEMRRGLQGLLPRLFQSVKSGKINELQFADFLAKYSIGVTGTVTHISPDVVSRLEKQALLIASRPQWETRELLVLLRDIWA